MHKLGKNIFFNHFQLQKKRNDVRQYKELCKNLRLLKCLDGKDFDEVYDYLFGMTNIKKSIFEMNLFPKTPHAIKKYRETEFVNNALYEIRWQLKLFSKYTKELSFFCLIKEKIDNFILEEEYSEALECLAEAEKKLGVSYWLLENKIFLYQMLGLNTDEIIKQSTKGFMALVLEMYVMKSSNSVSAQDYEYYVTREITKLHRFQPELNSLIDYYHYMIYPITFEMNDNSVNSLMYHSRGMALVDRFLCVMNIIEHYCAENNGETTNLVVDMCSKYVSSITDPRINAFIYSKSSDWQLREFSLLDTLDEIKNMIVEGNREVAWSNLQKEIISGCSDIPTFNAYIELCQLCGKRVDGLAISQTKQSLLADLNNIYSVSNDYRDALYRVYQICAYSFHARWSKDLYWSITKYVQPLNTRRQIIAKRHIGMSKLCYETIFDNWETKAIQKAALYNKWLVNKPYCSFRIAELSGEYEKASCICQDEKIAELVNLQSDMDVIKYDDYLSREAGTINSIRAAKWFWNIMESCQEVERGLDYFIQLFIQNEDVVIIAPIRNFIAHVEKNDFLNHDHIRIPIITYIYTTYYDAEKKDELSIACEDFFDQNNVTLPSQMNILGENYTKEQLVFFLRFICVPQIMGSVLLSIRTSRELDEERIAVCQKLRLLDPENENIYDSEIQDITHKLFISAGVSDIESHKIQVNTKGIKARIGKELRGLFSKYMYLRNAQLDPIIELIKNMENGENVSLYQINSSEIFNEIVTVIRNEFVSGDEYGLDAYLSLNIRHGTLPGQLRAPLNNKNLLAERVDNGENYDVSQRWLYKIKEQASTERAKCAIINFTKETEDIIDYLKKVIIQISTEEKPTQGLFSYHMDNAIQGYLQTFLTENCEFEDFIDFVFDYLWNQTENNLRRMRQFIREDIKKKYFEAFFKLQSVFLDYQDFFPEAIQWIKEAQNDIDAALEIICDWFQRSPEGQYADFALETAYQIGLQTICNIHPETLFKVDRFINETDGMMKGHMLKSYVAIFGTLFDNINAYALEVNNEKHFDCELVSNSTGVLIKMGNHYDPRKKDTEALRSSVDSALSLVLTANYLARARQEGGSGIPKIYRIIAIDLDLKPNITYSLDEKNNYFSISIEGKKK